MIFPPMRTVVLAALTTMSIAVPAMAATATAGSSGARPAEPARVRYARVRCMTDEGGGRFKPCDAAYKRTNPDWRSSDVCMVDDGDGRPRPCSLEYKRKQPKQ